VAAVLTRTRDRGRESADLWLLVMTVLLIAVGLVSVFSSSYVIAQDRYGDALHYLKRQLAALVVAGLPALWVGSRLNLRKLSSWALPSILIALLLLALTLALGKPIGGAKRWLGYGPVQLQTSEVAKIAVIVFAAWYISRSGRAITGFWRGVVPLLAVAGIACGLILVQPDLSTAFVVVVLCLAMLSVGGARWRHIVAIVLMLAILGGAAAALAPYRAKRVAAFLDPEAHKQDAAFQPYQSLIALGSGGLTGVGFSKSTQKYYYIPAAFTDFIFAIIGEEWGFVGTAVVVSLYAAFVARAVGAARGTKDVFGSLVALGIAVMIATEAAVHIAVATNAVPTTGMPLPFISYGGSSLVMKMFSVGLLLSISRRAVA
jgi:cell division protein FtsW